MSKAPSKRGEELKACPFCGASVMIASDRQRYLAKQLRCSDVEGCGASGSWWVTEREMDEATKRWNRRALASPQSTESDD